MNKTEVYPGVELPYYENASVGVGVSGGADSALLLYYLAKFSLGPIHVFTLYNRYKRGTNAKSALDVVQHVMAHSARTNIEHHVSYVDHQDESNLWCLPGNYLYTGMIKCMYSGVTANPPAHVIAKFRMDSGTHHDRDPNVIRSTRIGDFYTPWTNVDKSVIAKMYRQEQLMDSLFPLTRSCEWAPPMVEDTANPGTSHCGQCWWCEERYWGFDRYE
jgi:7-cyano-7-deazaguanine synthase in queuosine biosynthesis